MSAGDKDPLLSHRKPSSRLPSNQEVRCGEQDLGKAGHVATGMGMYPGLMGYLRLSTGVSGGSRLARGDAQLSQEKLKVCAEKEKMGYLYPSSLPPWEQEAWGPEG